MMLKLIWHLYEGNENCGAAFSHEQALNQKYDFKPRYVDRETLEAIIEDEVTDELWQSLKDATTHQRKN